MKKISINEKDYQIPQSLHEVSLKDYCRIFKGIKFDTSMRWKDIKVNESILVSRILGEGDDFALSLPLTAYNTVVGLCSFLYDVDKFKHTNVLTHNGIKYSIPSPDKFNLRKWIDIDVTRQTEDEGMFIELFAILLDPIGEDGECKPYDGKYEERKAWLEDYPADEAISMINDFFALGESLQKVTDAYSKVEEAINRFAHSTRSS